MGARYGASMSTANGAMLFNGQINAYNADVTLFATNPTTATARAGIVAKILTLQASASGTNLDVSGFGTSPTLGTRKVRLIATATGTASEPGKVIGNAVIDLPNDTTLAPTVISWRFQ